MIVITCGYPASGKSTYVQPLIDDGYHRLNRDLEGGKLNDLLVKAEKLIIAGKNVVLDNTYPTAELRAPVIALGKKHKCRVICMWLTTSIEDAQSNVCTRMVRKHGRLLTTEEIDSTKDPGVFPPAVLFKYKKDFEPPLMAEGFNDVQVVPFIRIQDKSYTNKAIILDFDGCLRRTKSGNKYPCNPDDIEILPGRSKKLHELVGQGYKLLGVSNQSGISKGELTLNDAIACFDKTCELLGVKIDYSFCPHHVPPITCYCRKPMPGLGIEHIEKNKLDRSLTVMVGDMTTDETFAKRCGIKFIHANKFFGE